MFANSRTWLVEWGDCDPAGIVFHPRYFAACDTSTTVLLEAAIGARKSEILRRFAIVGWPMVESHARYLAPARYGDEVTIMSGITRLGRSSFDLMHRLSRDGLTLVEERETRVWAALRADDPGRLSGAPLPADLLARLRT